MRFFAFLCFLLVLHSCDIKGRRPISPSAPPKVDVSKTIQGIQVSLKTDALESEMLQWLYQGDSILPNGEVLWYPDLEAATMTGITENTHMRASIDSVFQAEDGTGKTVTVVIIENKVFENGLAVDCHACPAYLGIAVFEAKEEQFELLRFRKMLMPFGNWGGFQGYRILHAGPETDVLVLQPGFSNMGQTNGQEVWLDFVHFSEILQYESIDKSESFDPKGNSGGLRMNSEVLLHGSASLKFYDVTIEQRIIYAADSLRNTNYREEVRRLDFRYDAMRSMYVPILNP
jgi:hypothetical protein